MHCVLKYRTQTFIKTFNACSFPMCFYELEYRFNLHSDYELGYTFARDIRGRHNSIQPLKMKMRLSRHFQKVLETFKLSRHIQNSTETFTKVSRDIQISPETFNLVQRHSWKSLETFKSLQRHSTECRDIRESLLETFKSLQRHST